MLKNYTELQTDHKDISNGIVSLAKLLVLMTGKHSSISTVTIENIVNHLNIEANKLSDIYNKYVDGNRIKDELLDENEANTANLLEITYEYGHVAETLNNIITEDILPLAKEVNDTEIIASLESLLN